MSPPQLLLGVRGDVARVWTHFQRAAA